MELERKLNMSTSPNSERMAAVFCTFAQIQQSQTSHVCNTLSGYGDEKK